MDHSEAASAAPPCAGVGAHVLPHLVPVFGHVQLGDALFGSSDEGVNPVGHGVEAVVLGQLEHRRRGVGRGLGEHGRPFLPRPFQERQLLQIAAGGVLVEGYRAPLDGPARSQTHLDEEVLAALARSVAFHRVHQDGRLPGYGRDRRAGVSAANQVRLAGGQRTLGRAAGPADVADAELVEHLGQGQELVVVGHLAGNETPVVGAVGQGLHGRPAEGAGLHGLALETLHLPDLLVGGPDDRPGVLHAHDVHAQGVEGHQRAHIDAQRMAVQTVHPLREALPVPAQAQLHGAHGNRLNPGHQAHGRFPVFGFARSKAEAALADGDRGHAVPAGHGGVGFPVELEVVVGVQINGSRGHYAARGVQFLGSGALDVAADHGDLAVLYGDIAPECRSPACAVDNRTVANNLVEIRHYSPSAV